MPIKMNSSSQSAQTICVAHWNVRFFFRCFVSKTLTNKRINMMVEEALNEAQFKIRITPQLTDLIGSLD